MMSPFGASTYTEYDALLDRPKSTQASTIALAVAALICILFSVRFAASAESVTLSSVAGAVPWAQMSTAMHENASAKKTMAPVPANRVLFIMFLPLNLTTTQDMEDTEVQPWRNRNFPQCPLCPLW